VTARMIDEETQPSRLVVTLCLLAALGGLLAFAAHAWAPTNPLPTFSGRVSSLNLHEQRGRVRSCTFWMDGTGPFQYPDTHPNSSAICSSMKRGMPVVIGHGPGLVGKNVWALELDGMTVVTREETWESRARHAVGWLCLTVLFGWLSASGLKRMRKAA
jgi:hypothetical protein